MKIVIRQRRGKAVKKPPFWGLCAVIPALFSACPPYLPENVQIKTEPAIYLPLGTPDSVQKELNAFYDDFTDAKPSSPEDDDGTVLYDFFSEDYGDALVFIAKIGLVETNLGGALPATSSPPPGIPIPEIKFKPLENGKDNPVKFDLSAIKSILDKYPGIKFRSIPVYLYVSGPQVIFDRGNVTITLRGLNSDDSTPLPISDLPSDASVTRQEAPRFPDLNEDPMYELLPKPSILPTESNVESKSSFDLKSILNMEKPPSSLDFQYTIKIEPITVKYGELDAVREDFRKPLSASLVVVLPFQFTAVKDVPILAGPNAISLLEDGKDLFGRVSEDDEGSNSMKDIFEMLRSLRIDINIENNIGLAGYAPVYKGKPNPINKEENLLGEMSLSGLSGIVLSKPEIAYPFNIWIEMYLREGQDFEIKRPREEPDAPPPLKLSLAVIVQTYIDKTL